MSPPYLSYVEKSSTGTGVSACITITSNPLDLVLQFLHVLLFLRVLLFLKIRYLNVRFYRLTDILQYKQSLIWREVGYYRQYFLYFFLDRMGISAGYFSDIESTATESSVWKSFPLHQCRPIPAKKNRHNKNFLLRLSLNFSCASSDINSLSFLKRAFFSMFRKRIPPTLEL
jgi:hypothetical protein